MNEFELENKSEMIYMNEDLIEQREPFVVKQDETGHWNATIIREEENNNEMNPEDDDTQESEGETDNDDTQESECETDNDDTQESECETDNDTQKVEGETISIDNTTDLLSSLFYFCILLMLFKWFWYVQQPHCVI